MLELAYALLDWYVDMSLKTYDYRIFFFGGNLVISILMVSVFLVAWRTTLQDEKWVLHFGLAYLTAVVQNALMVLFPHWLVGVGSPLSSLFLLAASRSLQLNPEKVVFPNWGFVALVISWCSLVLAEQFQWGLPFQRFPDAIFASVCFFLLGRAISQNIKGRGRWAKSWSSYGIFLGVAYGLGNILAGMNPVLANLQAGFNPLEMFPHGARLPVVDSMDLLVYMVFFFLKTGLFVAALDLLYRFQMVLSPRVDILEDVAERGTGYLDRHCRGGLLRAIGKTTSAEFVSLVIKVPGRFNNQVSWWGWFDEDLRAELNKPETWAAFDDTRLPKAAAVLRQDPKAFVYDDKHDDLVAQVFKAGKTLATSNYLADADFQTFHPYIPGMQSVVCVPVCYHGGVIAVLVLHHSDQGAFTRTTTCNVERLMRYSAATVHTRRELLALNRIGNQFEAIQADCELEVLGQEILKAVDDVIEPIVSVITFNLGFKHLTVARESDRLEGRIAFGAEDVQALLEHFPAESEGKDCYLLQDRLIVGYFSMGAFKKDRLDWPMLNRERLLRFSLADMIEDALVSGSEQFLGQVLRELQNNFVSEEVATPEQWFKLQQDALERLGVLSVMARLQGRGEGQEGFLGGSFEQEHVLETLVVESVPELNWSIPQNTEQGQCLREIALQKGVISHYPCSLMRTGRKHFREDVNFLMRVKMEVARAELWLGISQHFIHELHLRRSPWRSFLERLAELAGHALARIEYQQLERLALQQEINAQHAVLQSLWLHELGNKAAEMEVGIGTTLEKLNAEQYERAKGRVTYLLRTAKDFAAVAARLNKPVKVDDHRSEFPVFEAVNLLVEYYGVVFESKNIELSLHIDEKVRVGIPFTIFYLALSNLLSNALTALRRNGSIQVRAEVKGSQLYCHVTDSGSGVDPAVRKKIFRPGFSTYKGHSGQGLPASKVILNKSGGDLFYDESWEQGTRFTIVVPLATDSCSVEKSGV